MIPSQTKIANHSGIISTTSVASDRKQFLFKLIISMPDQIRKRKKKGKLLHSLNIDTAIKIVPGYIPIDPFLRRIIIRHHAEHVIRYSNHHLYIAAGQTVHGTRISIKQFHLLYPVILQHLHHGLRRQGMARHGAPIHTQSLSNRFKTPQN